MLDLKPAVHEHREAGAGAPLGVWISADQQWVCEREPREARLQGATLLSTLSTALVLG